MRKHHTNTMTLVLAGGIAAALVGAATASGWVWLRQHPAETARAHRKRATRFTAVAFGAAGAIGAAAAAALVGPRAAKPSMRALEHMAGRAEHDLGKLLERVSGAANAAGGAAKRYARHLH